MNKEQLKEAVGELNLVDTVFEVDGVSYIDTAVSVTQVYDLIDQLDEPEKVVIPQFVADWYESNKDDLTLEIYATAVSIREKPYDKYTVFEKWVNANNGNEPFETIIKMKLYGYDTEKEIKDYDKRYWPFAEEVTE